MKNTILQIFIVILLLVLIGVIMAAFNIGKPRVFAPEPEEVSCTLEAKICPDGTAVGRVGPNCEFAACPIEKEEIVGDDMPESEKGESCQNAGGAWDEEFSECLGVSQEICTEIGGVFDECASDCKNDPDAEICTLRCAQVCSL